MPTTKKAGATVLGSAEQVFEVADMIVKVKEPQLKNVKCCAKTRCCSPTCTSRLTGSNRSADESGTTAIAYETVTASDRSLPLLTPMSEVAGRLSIQCGAYALAESQRWSRRIARRCTGRKPGKVVVIGGGVSGSNAADMAVGLGADVTILDRSLPRLRQLDDIWGGRVHTVYSTKHAIDELTAEADLVVGAVLVAGAAAPKLVAHRT